MSKGYKNRKVANPGVVLTTDIHEGDVLEADAVHPHVTDLVEGDHELAHLAGKPLVLAGFVAPDVSQQIPS